MARPTFPVLTDDDSTGLTGTIINNAKVNEIKDYITKGLELKNLTELTIDSGVITITECFHTVDTESNDPSDDLVTINGGTTGAILVIKPVNDTHTIVVKHNTGNIWLKGQADITLDDLEDGLILIYTAGSKWIDLGAPTPVGGADPEEVRLPTPEGGDYATPSAVTASSEAGGLILNQQLQNDYEKMRVDWYERIAQRITLTGKTLTYVRFYLKKTDAPEGTLYVRVRRVSDDGIIETSATTLDVTTITTDYAWYEFALTCAPSEEVRICAEFSGGGGTNEVYVGLQNTDVCDGQVSTYFGSWGESATKDCTIILCAAGAANDAKDEDLATFWVPDPANEAGAWLKLDLGSLKYIGGCRIYWGSEIAYRPSEYKIYTSPDDSDWTEVIHEIEAASASAWKTYNWYVKKARYIKLIVTTHGASGTKIYEADEYSTDQDGVLVTHGHGGL